MDDYLVLTRANPNGRPVRIKLRRVKLDEPRYDGDLYFNGIDLIPLRLGWFSRGYVAEGDCPLYRVLPDERP